MLQYKKTTGGFMSCIKRMSSYPTYTKTEKRIYEYIIDHIDEVVYDTAQTLADKTMTSPSAIIRFSKNLGYRGFTELKVDLASESSNVKTQSFSEQINSGDALDVIIKKTRTSDIQAIEETYDLIHLESMKKAVSAIQKAKKVYLIGVGSSGICCEDLYQKLLRIQKDVFFEPNYHLLITGMTFMSKEDVIIGISYSGRTGEVNKAMKFAKEIGATTIGITQLPKNPLQKYLDIQLSVPTIEKDLRLGAVTSRNSALILIDLLYLGLIANDLDSYKTKLKATRAAVKQISHY